jgi:hypothetical protein
MAFLLWEHNASSVAYGLGIRIMQAKGFGDKMQGYLHIAALFW